MVNAMAGEAAQFFGFDDPRFLAFLRGDVGTMTESGAEVSVASAMKNATVLRCVSLIANSMGMLPVHVHRRDTKEKATEHPLFAILHRKPNAWQTAFEFRSLMQQWACQYGDAYARIVWSRGRVLQIVPLHPSKVTVEQTADWTLRYKFERKNMGPLELGHDQVFHLRYSLSDDGISGLSQVKQAAEAIGLAQQAERASARLFRNGMFVGGYLRHPGALSAEAYTRLKESIENDTGAENAHRWKLLEEGMDLQSLSQSGRDSQGIENRQHQVEEIARAFGGVPRPLLCVDDTSWGSGIDVLGQLFVRYSLNPWFEAWEQAIARDLLSDEDAEIYQAKYNPGGLLRGSMKDQAEFFAKALGAGGHQPWMGWEEVRDFMDMPVLDTAPPPPPGLSGKGDA